MVRKEVDIYGTIRYYNEQNRSHREDGPAIEYIDGHKFWLIDSLLHRVDGPAMEYPNRDKYYFIMGRHLSYEDWLAIKDYPLLW